MSWWDDYQNRRGKTQKDAYKDNFKNTVLANFKNSTSYFEVLINNEYRDVRIVDENFSNKNLYSKRILCKPDDTLQVGDDVFWNDRHWLCTSTDNDNEMYVKGIIEKCNNTLRFYKNCILYTIPCIFSDGSIDMQEGRFMKLPSGHYMITIPDTGVVKKSDTNLRFILNDAPYKIEGISNATNGLIKIELVDDVFTPDDNRELGIADYNSNQQVDESSNDGLTVDLTPATTTLMLGRTLELSAHAFNNGVEDLSRYYLYNISNADGTTNNYVTSTIGGNVCKLTASKTSSYAGKLINVHVEILGTPSVFYDRQIKLVSLL